MNKVYIVGLPASGKTKTGQWLAAKLGWQFLDLDERIEEVEQQSIAQIFEKKGEGHFRILESKALKETDALQNHVISTGGGAAAFDNNMDWMNEHGLTLYLNTPREEIVQRIILENDKRPLFYEARGSEISDILESLHELRKKFYSKSKIVYNKPNAGEMLYSSVNQLIEMYSEVY